MEKKHFLEWKDAVCVCVSIFPAPYIILENIRDYQAQYRFSSVEDINIWKRQRQ